MKFIGIYSVSFALVSCASTDIKLKDRDFYTIKTEKATQPMVGFAVPEGFWRINRVTLKTKDRGWFDIAGAPPQSPVGYAVRLSISKEDKNDPYYKLISNDFKNKDLKGFSQLRVPWANDKNFAEMKVINYKHKLVRVGNFNCRGITYQQNGVGGALHLNVNCPLVIDGELYYFVISSRSGFRADFVDPKQPPTEKPPTPIERIEFLDTLSDRVLAIFNDIKFYGNASQNYADLK